MKLLKFIALVWVVETFQTYDGVARFLQTLPIERALEAKVVCSDWNWPCAIFYRK